MERILDFMKMYVESVVNKVIAATLVDFEADVSEQTQEEQPEAEM